jgi:hypothetical protein
MTARSSISLTTDRVNTADPRAAALRNRAPAAAAITSAAGPPSTRRGEVLTLIAVCLGTMMTFLQITAATTALSAIQTDLHVSPTGLVWIPSAYALLVASLVLSAGTLGNLYALYSQLP